MDGQAIFEALKKLHEDTGRIYFGPDELDFDGDLVSATHELRQEGVMDLLVRLHCSHNHDSWKGSVDYVPTLPVCNCCGEVYDADWATTTVIFYRGRDQ